jgi:hypothetical protein
MCVFCTKAFARFAGRLHGLAPSPSTDAPLPAPPDQSTWQPQLAPRGDSTRPDVPRAPERGVQ